MHLQKMRTATLSLSETHTYDGSNDLSSTNVDIPRAESSQVIRGTETVGGNIRAESREAEREGSEKRSSPVVP